MKSSLKVMSACFAVAMASEANAVTVYSQDFNANDGGYTVSNTGPVADPWTYSGAGPNGNWFTNGTDNLNLPGIPSSSALTSPTINVTTGGPLTLSFLHRYNFEFDGIRWEGGAVFVSVNAGAFQYVPIANFLSNGYDGVLTGNTVLNGQQGFNGVSGFPGDTTPIGQNAGIFITSVASIGNFNVGDTLSVRFLGTWDEFAEGNLPNWEITTVTITGVDVPEPATALFGVLSLAALARRRRAVQW